MKRLVIDDDRVPEFDAVVVRDPVEALAAIVEQPWDEVWMDVDNDYQRGMHYTWVTAKVRDLCRRKRAPDVGLWVLHSANPGGRETMKKHLRPWYPVVDIEDYDDQTVRLRGVNVVSVSAARGVERYRVDDVRQWWNPLPDPRRSEV